METKHVLDSRNRCQSPGSRVATARMKSPSMPCAIGQDACRSGGALGCFQAAVSVTPSIRSNCLRFSVEAMPELHLEEFSSARCPMTGSFCRSPKLHNSLGNKFVEISSFVPKLFRWATSTNQVHRRGVKR